MRLTRSRRSCHVGTLQGNSFALSKSSRRAGQRERDGWDLSPRDAEHRPSNQFRRQQTTPSPAFTGREGHGMSVG